MKKITILTLTLIFSFQLFSQEMQPVNQKPVNTDYLAKSKKQRKAGWIMTGTGAGLMTIGVLGVMSEGLSMVYEDGASPDSETEQKSAFGPVLATGAVLLATGFTFLMVAKDNKKKALSMAIINESSQQLRYNTVMNTSVPSIRLRLHF